MRYLTVTPAYGVDYSSKAEVIRAWNNQCDFRVQDYEYSGYITKSEATGFSVVVRYCRLTKLVNVPN